MAANQRNFFMRGIVLKLIDVLFIKRFIEIRYCAEIQFVTCHPHYDMETASVRALILLNFLTCRAFPDFNHSHEYR